MIVIDKDTLIMLVRIILVSAKISNSGISTSLTAAT